MVMLSRYELGVYAQWAAGCLKARYELALSQMWGALSCFAVYLAWPAAGFALTILYLVTVQIAFVIHVVTLNEMADMLERELKRS